MKTVAAYKNRSARAFLNGVGSVLNIRPAFKRVHLGSAASDKRALQRDAVQFAADFQRAVKAVSHGK